MSLTRRGLFGFVARAAAAVGLAKVAAAMPEVPAAAAQAPFRGTFTFPEGLFLSTSFTMKCYLPRYWTQAVLDPPPYRGKELAWHLHRQAEIERELADPIGSRVRRHVAESREDRWRARTPARLFWGLP